MAKKRRKNKSVHGFRKRMRTANSIKMKASIRKKARHKRKPKRNGDPPGLLSLS